MVVRNAANSSGMLILTVIIILALFASCSESTASNIETGEEGYMSISAEEAKKIIDSQTDYVILDVRTAEEFDEGHIENALLIPDYEIDERAGDELDDKTQLILVYCRSGRRSKLAAEKLANLGYTNVKEFGGIIDWPYETVSES